MKPLVPLLFLLAGAPFAAADDTRPKAGEAFLHHYDSNGDGRVSLDEYQAPAAKQFMLIDLDGDGSITAEEATAYVDKIRNEMMRDRDN